MATDANPVGLSVPDQRTCIYKIRRKECPAEYIEQTIRQLKTQIKEHKRKEKCRLSKKTALSKLERGLAIALHAMAEEHNIDYENPRVFPLGFRTCTERKYTEALAVSFHPTCTNRNDGAEVSEIWAVLTLQFSSRGLNAFMK